MSTSFYQYSDYVDSRRFLPRWRLRRRCICARFRLPWDWRFDFSHLFLSRISQECIRERSNNSRPLSSSKKLVVQARSRIMFTFTLIITTMIEICRLQRLNLKKCYLRVFSHRLVATSGNNCWAQSLVTDWEYRWRRMGRAMSIRLLDFECLMPIKLNIVRSDGLPYFYQAEIRSPSK